MSNSKIDQLLLQLENYSECWKQFIRFINVARSGKFGDDDESQFLELKCIMTQELELILAQIEFESPTKEEILALITSVPSIKYVSETGDGTTRAIENQWHKIFIAWQSNLGQLKVQTNCEEEKPVKSRFSLFSSNA
jgi:hypothetical protein